MSEKNGTTPAEGARYYSIRAMTTRHYHVVVQAESREEANEIASEYQWTSAELEAETWEDEGRVTAEYTEEQARAHGFIKETP
jgi:hypothetical protein